MQNNNIIFLLVVVRLFILSYIYNLLFPFKVFKIIHNHFIYLNEGQDCSCLHFIVISLNYIYM